MKLNSLQKLYICLKNELPEVKLSDEVIEKRKTNSPDAGSFKINKKSLSEPKLTGIFVSFNALFLRNFH